MASALVVFLMPAGLLLDYFVYPNKIGYFLGVRLGCSALASLVWFLHHRQLWAEALPFSEPDGPNTAISAIAWMIHKTEGPASPYYAGLNLILLAISVVVRWNVLESLVA